MTTAASASATATAAVVDVAGKCHRSQNQKNQKRGREAVMDGHQGQGSTIALAHKRKHTLSCPKLSVRWWWWWWPIGPMTFLALLSPAHSQCSAFNSPALFSLSITQLAHHSLTLLPSHRERERETHIHISLPFRISVFCLFRPFPLLFSFSIFAFCFHSLTHLPLPGHINHPHFLLFI